VTTGITTYGDINQRTAAYAAREMLKHAEPVLVLQKFGLSKPLPSNTAATMKFRRPIPFVASTVPLAEGVTPSPQKMAYEDVSVTVRQYGNVVTVTDWVADTAEDPVLNDATMLIGEQAGASAEQIVYNAVKGGTTVIYANGASRSVVNTPITLSKQRAVVRQLKSQKAKKITRILSSGPDYGVSAVEAAYICVCHTNCEADIRNITGFVPVAKYGDRQTVSEYELGTIEDVRYVTSADLAPFADAGGPKAGSGTTMLSTSGTNSDIYPFLFFGQDCFGLVPLKGASAMTPVVVNAKPSDSDPLAQRSHVGYKFGFAAVNLNETWMARLEAAATALP
jgi:N4-gp56 family major capsid protein